MITLIILLLLWLGFGPAAPAASPVIDAANVGRLRPDAQVDFAAYGSFRAGWFALSEDGTRAAAADAEGRIWEFTRDGGQVLYTAPDFATGAYVGDAFIGAHTTPEGVAIYWPAVRGPEPLLLPLRSGGLPDYPAEMYASSAGIALDMQPTAGDQRPYVAALNWETHQRVARLERVGAADVVRIGRIPPPYMVTSTETGIVSLWDWTTAALLRQADNTTGMPSVFGSINAAATHLAWRDNASEALYLLDLAQGTNQMVDRLNGAYAQWYFLSLRADVIIAVNLGFQPDVVAWQAETGQRLSLGPYRPCSRPQPDMARLSNDGTTLVIGCADGLEFWTVGDEP
jgi:hypothetical protein